MEVLNVPKAAATAVPAPPASVEAAKSLLRNDVKNIKQLYSQEYSAKPVAKRPGDREWPITVFSDDDDDDVQVKHMYGLPKHNLKDMHLYEFTKEDPYDVDMEEVFREVYGSAYDDDDSDDFDD